MKRASPLIRRQVVKLGIGTAVEVGALALCGSRVFAGGEEPHLFINVDMTEKGYLYKNDEVLLMNLFFILEQQS